ncbi:hypothetical protein [Nesterenkonia sp. HG001]|nr:hypothetical protein [Nesterenkonia sp. HG001]MDZ5076733.1 hypothetical protein [Nesterenkonia sp. HG001]
MTVLEETDPYLQASRLAAAQMIADDQKKQRQEQQKKQAQAKAKGRRRR